jgi:hypothetical protein
MGGLFPMGFFHGLSKPWDGDPDQHFLPLQSSRAWCCRSGTASAERCGGRPALCERFTLELIVLFESRGIWLTHLNIRP